MLAPVSSVHSRSSRRLQPPSPNVVGSGGMWRVVALLWPERRAHRRRRVSDGSWPVAPAYGPLRPVAQDQPSSSAGWAQNSHRPSPWRPENRWLSSRRTARSTYSEYTSTRNQTTVNTKSTRAKAVMRRPQGPVEPRSTFRRCDTSSRCRLRAVDRRRDSRDRRRH